METSGPRGTYDILPEDSYRWQMMESVLREKAELFGYSQVRLPIFEHTELFERGVGDTTDIVQKEMYSFRDRGDRSITLRPEGTASCARAFIEHKVYNQIQPTKWYYTGPMFRYDRPQAGRYRQFHQFGIEAFGSDDPTLDAEIITLMVHMVKALEIDDCELHLNTVGCRECRPLYRQRLIQFLTPLAGELCNDCRQRVDRNPLRVLDCKNKSCQQAIAGFPSLFEYLCSRCGQHFEAVQNTLSIYKIPYIIDAQLVRGLDYYTNTAFELQIPAVGGQSAVGGGGRYNGLIEECGGPSTPGIGFALGLERILLARQNKGLDWQRPSQFDVYVAALDKDFDGEACLLLDILRKSGIKADKDYMSRSLKAQMKMAGKAEAALVIVIGEDEINQGFYTLRNMKKQEQKQIPRDQIVDQVKAILGQQLIY